MISAVVTSYNRPDSLYQVVKDLAHEQIWLPVSRISQPLDVVVYDDCSTVNMYRSRQLVLQHGWDWVHFEEHRGIAGYIKTWKEALQHAFDEGADFVFAIPDDARLCNSFFDKVMQEWSQIADPKKAGMNLIHEEGRGWGPAWIRYKIEPGNKTKRVQWMDGLCMLSRAAVGFILDNKVLDNPTHIGRDGRSSGVWSTISGRLHQAGYGIYMSPHSFMVHTLTQSVMHPEHRKAVPVYASNFIDGPEAHAKLLQNEETTANLATIPSRRNIVEKAIDSLYPQVDKVRVLCNSYELDDVRKLAERYEDLPIEFSHSGKNCGSSGKFLWADPKKAPGDASKFLWAENAQGYYFSCDDDIEYPPDYVFWTLRCLHELQNKAYVTYHGRILKQPLQKSYYDGGSTSLHFRFRLRKKQRVHVPGTGVACFHGSSLKVQLSDFKSKNMADIWMAILCQKQGVPVYVLPHEENWLKALPTNGSIYDSRRRNDGELMTALREAGAGGWKLQ